MLHYNEKNNKYEIRISNSEFVPLITDVVKYAVIILVFNFMMYSADKNATTFARSFTQVLYIAIALLIYHLIVKKVLMFVA